MKRGYYFYFTIHFTGSKKENGVNGCYTLKYPHNSSNSERQIDVFESMNSARTVLICLTGMVIMAFTVYSHVYSVQCARFEGNKIAKCRSCVNNINGTSVIKYSSG